MIDHLTLNGKTVTQEQLDELQQANMRLQNIVHQVHTNTMSCDRLSDKQLVNTIKHINLITNIK